MLLTCVALFTRMSYSKPKAPFLTILKLGRYLRRINHMLPLGFSYVADDTYTLPLQSRFLNANGMKAKQMCAAVSSVRSCCPHSSSSLVCLLFPLCVPLPVRLR